MFNPLGHFQAESAGRAWFVRKSSIYATTFDFSILATRRSGNPASVGAPHMIHTQVDLTRVQSKSFGQSCFIARGIPTLSIRPDTWVRYLWNDLVYHCLCSSRLPPCWIYLLARQESGTKKAGRPYPEREPQAPPTILPCFADTLGQGRKRLHPGLGSAQLGSA